MTPRLDIVELAVADWGRSVAWYCTALGCEEVMRDRADGYALLSTGGAGANIAVKRGEPKPGTTKLVFAVDDLDVELQRLVDAGVTPEGPVESSDEGYRSVEVRDPDGYLLVLYDMPSLPLASDVSEAEA